MKARLLYVLIAVMMLPLVSHAETPSSESASELLRKVSDRLGKEKSFTIDFSVMSQGQPFKGSLLLSGDRFRMVAGDVTTWYDGATQWTLSDKEKEVTVIEPTPEELQQINPFAILGSFRSAYDASFAKVSPEGTRVIVLKAKSPRAQISTAQISVNPQTLDTKIIELLFNNRQKVTIHVTAVKTGGAPAASVFSFDKSKYPGVTVNDMR